MTGSNALIVFESEQKIKICQGIMNKSCQKRDLNKYEVITNNLFSLLSLDATLGLIHDVNPSQLGEAQWLREALLTARRGPVVHRATTLGLINGFLLI